MADGLDEQRLPDDFDPEWYRRTYPDVAATGQDPMQHYLRIGRIIGRAPNAAALKAKQENRVVSPSTDLLDTVLSAAAAPAIGHPPSAEDSPLIPAPGGFVRPVPGPAPTAALPLSEGETTPLLRAITSSDAKALCGPLRLYAALVGADPAVLLDRTEPRIQAGALDPLEPDALPACATPALRTGPSALEDIWLADSGRLRIRLGDIEADRGEGLCLSAFQAPASAADRPVQVDRQTLVAQGVAWIDIELRDPLMPVLLELSDRTGATLGLALLPFPSLVRGGLHYPELAGRLTGRDGLMRGFWAVSDSYLRARFSAPPALTDLRIDTAGAIGSEPAFDPAVQAWIERIFGLRLGALGDTARPQNPRLAAQLGARPDDEAGATEGTCLILPGDAVPTIAALLSPTLSVAPGARAAGAFLVGDADTRRPRWSVSLPLAALPVLPDLQPQTGIAPAPLLVGPRTGPRTAAAADPVAALKPLHLSIAWRPGGTASMPEMAMPVAPDAPTPILPLSDAPAPGGLTLALTASDPEETGRFLEMLVRQTGHDRIDVIAGFDDDAPATGDMTAFERRDALRAAIAGAVRGRIEVLREGRWPDVKRIADFAGGGIVLFAGDDIRLPDTRTFATLSALLGADGTIGSAACAVLRESQKGKKTMLSMATGGLFPSHVSLMTAPQLIFAEPDCLPVLPNATYPVAANALRFALVRHAALVAALPLMQETAGPSADIALGLGLGAAGYHSLCCSAVRVGTELPEGLARDEMDPVGLSAVLPQAWDRTLASVTLLRQIL
ncbi:hypothetical protein ATO6_22700 [Oceanicola sp. 22II-s10i]|uniref:hypothetical protein n=1 Tax=Oceanicola sp. 22II-s10i TaxID=1317116 RepID=UPI000B526849|nr:hypothetical protein [Oceanicola sp. 22II-s10i]OWU82255.1 hypothetical protein ATO6_22700 [Oceanicola sp. 22II-s10i]